MTEPGLKVRAKFGIITSRTGLYPDTVDGFEKVIFAVMDDPISADEGTTIEEVGWVPLQTRCGAKKFKIR